MHRSLAGRSGSKLLVRDEGPAYAQTHTLKKIVSTSRPQTQQDSSKWSLQQSFQTISYDLINATSIKTKADIETFESIKGGPEPLEKDIHEILGSKREDRFSNPVLNWYKIPLWFVFRTYFASAIYVRPRGTCESSRRSARRQPDVEGAPFMYTTSDRVDTWLILSGTTGSRQYHESTMV